MSGLASVLGLSLLSGGPVGAAEQPDFTGEWKRNPELSQEWRDKVETLADPLEGRKDRPERRVFRRRLRQIFEEIDVIEIEQSEADFKIVSAADRVRIYYLGRQHTRQSEDGIKIQAACRWIGEEFMIEQSTADGSKITERLTMLGAGRMSHTVRWQDKRLTQPLVIRSVFDRAE